MLFQTWVHLVLSPVVLLYVFVFDHVSTAAKGKGKGTVKDVLKGPEVCKDPVRLTSHAVGVNIYKQGEDPSLKPKEDYPAW